MDKPDRNDYVKYPPGTAGQKKFDDDMDLYNAERRKAGDAAATANRQGAAAATTEKNSNYATGYKTEGAAAAAPIGEVSGKSNAEVIPGGPDPKDAKYQGMAGEMLFAKDVAAFKRSLEDEKTRKANVRQMQ